MVFHQHDPADTLHLIDKGRFAVRVATPLGDTAILAVLGPGDMFGELSLLGDADARRSATVAALEAGETRSVHRLDFERLRSHASRDRVGAHLDPLRAGAAAVAAPARGALRAGRQARAAAAARGGATLYGDGVVPLTQDDLAGLAGTSRATVNRVLREEASRGRRLGGAQLDGRGAGG